MNTPKIQTDLLWNLAVFFFAFGLVYLISAFIYKKRKTARNNLVTERKTDLAPMISAFLFFNPDSAAVLHEEYIEMKIKIRQMLKQPVNREVLTEILMDLRKDLAGDAQEQVFDLYQDLGLHKDAFKKLRSWRWEVVSRGIEELTEMRVTHAYAFIRKFVNDSRSVIRKQAQLATVTLMPEGIGYFLDTAKYRISEWQQLSLLDVLRHKEDFEPPPFKNWLISGNRDVILFALRLIKYYNQSDSSAELIALAKHKNNQVKLEAIECIDKFHVVDALETLKGVFKKCNAEVKLAILNTIGNMGSENEIEFLDEVSRNDSNFIIRNKALSSINAVLPGMILPTEDLVKVETYQPEEAPAIPHNPYPEIYGLETDPAEQDEYNEVEEMDTSFLEEDEEVFDSCFMEELKEILMEVKPEDEPREELPLDFLPFVLNDGENKPNIYSSEIPLWEIEVDAEEVIQTVIPEITTDEVPSVDWDRELAGFEEKIADGLIPEEEFVENSFGFISENPEAVPETENIGTMDIQDLHCPAPTGGLPGKSVFASLFAKSDHGEKLILLEEIGKIGEEKEWLFLISLDQSEHPEILRKAQNICTVLEKKWRGSSSGEEQTLESIEDVKENAWSNEKLLFEPELSINNETDLPGGTRVKTAFSFKKLLTHWRQIVYRA